MSLSLFSLFLSSASQINSGQEAGPAPDPSNDITYHTLRTQLVIVFVVYFCMNVDICFRGLCRGCGSELESIQLTAEEYQELKDRVMADVIQGPDVFKKTTPEVHLHRHMLDVQLSSKYLFERKVCRAAKIRDV